MYAKLNARRSAAGFSLAEVLVAVAVLTLTVTIMFTRLSNIRAQQSFIELDGTVSAIRTEFTRNVDCSASLAATVSPTTGRIDCAAVTRMLRADGSTMWQSTGDGLLRANWYLSLSCDPTAGLTVNLTKKASDGTVMIDPLGRRPIDATHTGINPIFGPGSFYQLCPEYFAARPRIFRLQAPLSNPTTMSVITAMVTTGLQSTDCTTASTALTVANGPAIRAATDRLDQTCVLICKHPAYSYLTGYLNMCLSGNTSYECTCVR